MDDRPSPGIPDLSRRRLLALSALAASSPGCLASMNAGRNDIQQLSAEAERVDPQVDEGTLDQLVADNTSFALALQRELQAAEAETNLFSSPYSVSVALAMAYAGARGRTAEGMRDALRFSLPDDELHPAFNRLTRVIERDTESDEEDGEPFRLRAVNALWGQQGFPFRESYLERLAAHYEAGLNTVDFASDTDAARAAINSWVADRTEGRIEELLGREAVGPMTRLVLTNAIYFLASWAVPFDEERTEDRPFDNIDGTTSQVPTMLRTAEMAHAVVDGHQAVELPYKGGTASMLVILPAEGRFDEFLGEFDRSRLSAFVDALRRSKGTLALPKFTYESSFSLSSPLSELGMERAFDATEADFAEMYNPEESGGNLYIQDVVHKAFVAVDEQGTEAAAATGVSVGIISVSPGGGWEMIVDRPFLFLIRDTETGSIVFLGAVVDATRFQ